jgi:hypothetical protein
MNTLVIEYEKRDSVVESIITLLNALPHVRVKGHDVGVAEDSGHIPNRQTLEAIEEVKRGDTLKFEGAEDLKKYLYA